MSPPEVWGPAIWSLFHTLSEKINEHTYNAIYPQLFLHFQKICKYLPCPECSRDASIFLEKIKIRNLKTKHDFKNLFYLFHNYVNAKKRKQLFNYSGINIYKNYRIMNVINNFFVNYNTKGNMKLLTETFQRQFIIKDFKKWFTSNITAFFQPNIPQPINNAPVEELNVDTPVETIVKPDVETFTETNLVKDVDLNVEIPPETPSEPIIEHFEEPVIEHFEEPVIEQDVEQGDVTHLETDLEKDVETDLETHVEPVVETDLETHVEPVVETDLETHVETYIEPDVETDVEPDVEPDLETDVEPDVETDVEPDVETDVEPDVETDVEPVVETDVEPDVVPDVETHLESDVETHLEPDVEPDVEHDVETYVEPDVEPDIEPDDDEVIKYYLQVHHSCKLNI